MPEARSSRLPDPGESVLAIADGMVLGISDVGSASAWLINWPQVTEVVRMPHAAGRRFYNKPWPGRDAALAILAQEAEQ